MKKRILALFLCLTMLLGTVALLASCGDEEPTPEAPPAEDPVNDPVEVSETTVTVELDGYKIVRPEAGAYTDVLKQQSVDLSAAITDATGTTIRIEDDKGSVSNDSLEILLGFGSRDVANQALNELEGNGWIIRTYADQGKIVIAGTTEFLTGIALRYFIANCLEETAEGQLTIADKIICNEMEMVEVVGMDAEGKRYEGKYSFVYQNGLDDKKGSSYSETDTVNYDKPVALAHDLKNMVIAQTGVNQATLPHETDDIKDKDKSGKAEILLGVVDRDEARAALARINPNQYSLTVTNGTIVLGGLNDTMLVAAGTLFTNMITQSVQKTATGEKYVLIPANYSYIEDSATDRSMFAVDFPQPDNLYLKQTVDVGTNSMLFVYDGEEISRDVYLAYCAKLEDAGYEVISAEYQAEGSSFRTYLNRTEKITLHVSHQAHTHAEEQGVTAYPPSIRVVSAYTNKIDFDEELFNPNKDYKKITDTMITNYELNRTVGAWGNSMIITLEDGSFIVFDGGHVGKTGSSNDEDSLYNVLLDLYKKTRNNQEPTREDPIRISWFLSHEHSDHFGVFRMFIKKYGPDATVKIDRVMSNFISVEERPNTHNPEAAVQNNIRDLKSYGDDFDFIKVHTGEIYYIANAAIRIMYTHEDIYPKRLEYFNNSSTVFNVGLNSTNAALGTTSNLSKSQSFKTLILLGDLERVGSRCLRSMYGEAMQADMVQVAHHGYNGCEEALYKLINPEVVWWPSSNGEVMSQTRASYANSTNWINSANYGVGREIDRVKLIVTGGDTNQNDKGYNFTLTLTVDGIDYENFYDAIGHKIVVTDDDIPPQGSTGIGYVILRPGK